MVVIVIITIVTVIIEHLVFPIKSFVYFAKLLEEHIKDMIYRPVGSYRKPIKSI